VTDLPNDWFPRPVPANVVVGERSWLYSAFAFLHYRSRRPCGLLIGHDSGVYNGSFFDLGPRGEVKIGNYCTLVGAVIACDSRVEIGDYTFIAHEVVLADGFAAGPRRAREETVDGPIVTSIEIGANCWVGARAVLLAGARLGAGAVVGAAAVVDFDIPPFAVVAGNPARVVGSCAPTERERA
jgi:acetyltransferase-like isoleucine patch superfamily enzyme